MSRCSQGFLSLANPIWFVYQCKRISENSSTFHIWLGKRDINPFAHFPVPLPLPMKEVILFRVHRHPALPDTPTDYWVTVKSWTILSLLQQYHIYIQECQWFSNLYWIKSRGTVSFRFFHQSGPDLIWLSSCQNGLSILPHKHHYHLRPSALAYPIFSNLTFLFFIPYLPKAPSLGSCSHPAVSE